MTTVTKAVRERRSVRAFTDAPIAPALLREIAELAQLAPSGGNMQPWRLHLVTGPVRRELATRIRAAMFESPVGTFVPPQPEFSLYPSDLPAELQSRKVRAGAALHAADNIARDDKEGRLRQAARNFDFYDAPVGGIVTVPRTAGPLQFVDVGLFLQTFTLLAVERGLSVCIQAAWANWHSTVRTVLALPPDELVICGISIGYADAAAAINAVRAGRASSRDVTIFHGWPGAI